MKCFDYSITCFTSFSLFSTRFSLPFISRLDELETLLISFGIHREREKSWGKLWLSQSKDHTIEKAWARGPWQGIELTFKESVSAIQLIGSWLKGVQRTENIVAFKVLQVFIINTMGCTKQNKHADENIKPHAWKIRGKIKVIAGIDLKALQILEAVD